MKKGFTLVELSIVLVIIGLLIGGILVGQSMIESSQINSQLQQFSQYDIAARNFKEKFKQLPGDCSICDHSMSSYTNVAVNGVLEDNNYASPPVRLIGEAYFFFIDMSTMGTLKGSYKWASSSWQVGSSQQFPAAKIGKSGIAVSGTRFGNWYYFFMDSASNSQMLVDRLTTGFLSASQSLAIDSKIDDGSPITGSVRAFSAATIPNATSQTPFNAEADNSTSCVYNSIYNTTLSSTTLCRIYLKAEFK